MCDEMKGPGCAHCPVNRFDCDAQYRGSRCVALRAKAGVDFDPQTNSDRLLRMGSDERRNTLIEYFSKWADVGDSYIFDLSRVKEAFAVGTMSFDDFEEWGEERVAQLVDEFLDWLQSPAEAAP